MTPHELVKQHWSFPSYIQEKPRQIQAINEQATLPNSGLWLQTGTGKTLVQTGISLYKRLTSGVPSVGIMPPILVEQWAQWLLSVRSTTTGKPPVVVAYKGTPAQRKALKFEGADFVLAGSQIFMRDYDRFMEYFLPIHPHVFVDEATMVANIGSQTHEAIYSFAVGCDQSLLSGTPADNPMNAYGLLKFTNPGAYRNLKHFENLHVQERDYFDKPCKFMNLDLLKENLSRNSQRVLFSDMYPDIETPMYVPIKYQLAPEHRKLYVKLAEQQLLDLPDGGKLDATNAGKVLHALGQLVMNWGYFAQDPKLVSEGFLHLEQKMEELGKGKMVVYAHYRMTIAEIVARYGKKYGAVAINSEVSDKGKQEAKRRFIEDPSCRLISIQPRSGGYGLDGLQHVCHYSMFLEPCTVPRDFHQSVARLVRGGQKEKVVVYLPMAEGTLQIRRFNQLLANDELMNQIVVTKAELRKMIFGE